MTIRAVLDTNVLVSGMVTTGGAPGQILDAWIAGHFILVTSPYLVEELLHVLSYPHIAMRLRLEEEELETILASLLSQAEVIPDPRHLRNVTRDPKDDAVVACASTGRVDYLVSGDQDLLILHEYEGIPVVTPRQFVETLRAQHAL